MSKKRNYELGSKWRLGKLNADYKTHKIKKKLGYDMPDILRRKKAKPKARVIRCKHEYQFVETTTIFSNWKYDVHECNKCKKRKSKRHV